MGLFFTRERLRDDKSGNFYHFTKDLNAVKKSQLLYAGADGRTYVVAHKNNYSLGTTTSVKKLGVVVFQATSGINFQKCPNAPVYDAWKRRRGEWIGEFGKNIQIHRWNETQIDIHGKLIPALEVLEASYVQQIGRQYSLSLFRKNMRLLAWNFELAFLCSVIYGLEEINFKFNPDKGEPLHIWSVIIAILYTLSTLSGGLIFWWQSKKQHL
ncbi:hypothetical protein hmeg3_07480 [Herbaspirillum sp. meg3]|uniref:hypothetical protein n=1 Tax=Herbaspirillum sp. meg3 TaxID=2025949 RepID=UPI000B98DB38|nr:hypothetical protein [Herbaspirillum sp. meg3]ASU38157.1 hypothetical protein hmeg3_07480 [Herbaspirillum sp. meg3]